MRSENRTASEKLGVLKIQPRRLGESDNSSTEFPDISAFASMSYTEYFREMRENPLAVVDECQKAFFQFQTSIRRQLYELVALIYGFALILHSDEATRASFLKKPYWENHAYKKKDHLRMAFQFCLKASKGESNYGRACTYARALSSFFKQGVPMEEIPDLIEKHGGIEELAQKNKKRLEGESKALPPGDEGEPNPTIDEDDDSESERQPPLYDFLADLDDGKSSSPRKRSLASQPPNWDPSRNLVVSMEPTELQQAISGRRGGKLRLDLIVVDRVGGWSTFKVENMRWRD